MQENTNPKDDGSLPPLDPHQLGEGPVSGLPESAIPSLQHTIDSGRAMMKPIEDNFDLGVSFPLAKNDDLEVDADDIESVHMDEENPGKAIIALKKGARLPRGRSKDKTERILSTYVREHKGQVFVAGLTLAAIAGAAARQIAKRKSS